MFVQVFEMSLNIFINMTMNEVEQRREERKEQAARIKKSLDENVLFELSEDFSGIPKGTICRIITGKRHMDGRVLLVFEAQGWKRKNTKHHIFIDDFELKMKPFTTT